MAEAQTTVRIVDQSGQDRIDGTLYSTIPISSGSLPTQSFSSGVGAQILTTRNVTAYIVTTTSGVGGTAAIALSPDNTTYSTLGTIAPGVSGAVTLTTVEVKAGWYLKITVATASITSVTYA